jgi:molecular chaperone Hsp33
MAEADDDLVIPFEIKPLAVRGRLVRLGAALDAIVQQHRYPDVVSAVLSEGVAITAMLGSLLKVEGQFILQTSTNGPLDLLVSQYTSPAGLRAYARFDANAVEGKPPGSLLGTGHLAMTIDQGANTERYQGIVAVGEGGLSEAALTYFRQSEQIPTWLKTSVGPLISRGDATAHWRAGALMVQHLPAAGESHRAVQDLAGGDDAAEAPENESWTRARLLAQTVEDHELLDPSITPERLLYRIFHEDGVTVYPATRLVQRCNCSRDRVRGMLKSFSQAEQSEMAEAGAIKVKCEFCSKEYEFSVSELDNPVQ